MLALVVGHIAEAMVAAPERLPDIHVLWNLTVCWGCFMIYWGWLIWGLWRADVSVLWNGYFSREKKTQ